MSGSTPPRSARHRQANGNIAILRKWHRSSEDSNEVVGNELSDVGNVFVCGYHVPCCVVFGPSLVGQ